jgi:hypothetical protein
MSAVNEYFRTLVGRFGSGWNRFWFTPSDPITLGVIRLLTALVALGLYLTYWPDLQRFFGPNGLLSRDAMLALRGNVPVFSLFDYAQSASALTAMYWAGAVALVLMLVGLFTRLTSILALVAVLSLIHRGPVLVRPVDDIVAMLMFYLCIGPCGATLSLDSLLFGRRGSDQPVGLLPSLLVPRLSTAGTVSLRLMQVHLTAIYAAMALAKLKGAPWWDGSAVWGLIARPESRVLDLRALGTPSWTYVINIWTLAIVGFELCFALLIWNRLARPLLLAIALPMWLLTALVSGRISFGIMMLVANLAFISPGAMRACLAGGERLKAEGLKPRA